MGDLVWVRFFFFPGPMELEIFSPTYNGVRFFVSIIRHEHYFFQCRIIFFPGISLQAFFPSKSCFKIMVSIFFLSLFLMLG